MNYLEESDKWLGLHSDQEIINEEKVWGVKIDKNKLNDEKYVNEIIKQINKASKEKNNGIVEKIISILVIISLLSIVGIPVAILLSFLTLKLVSIREQINTKDLKKIDSYLEKSIDKLKKSGSKAQGKEKKEYQEHIKKLEKNREKLYSKINISNDKKQKNYGNIITDADKQKLYKIIKKDLLPIIDNYNKSKKKEIRKELDEYLDDVCQKNDPEDVKYWKNEFGKYYSSGVPTIKCKIEEKNNTSDIYILLFDVESKRICEALNNIGDSICKEFKQKSKLSNSITKIYIYDLGYMIIEFNILKVKEYLNSSVNESYISEGRSVKMNKINTLAQLARSNGIENTTRRLRDDIVLEYTDIIDSLNSIEESVIGKDISLLPVYKINEGLFGFGKKEKNPYKEIIKQYKDDKINNGNIINKNKNDIKKILDNHFKSKKGTEISFSENSDTEISVNISEPYYNKNYLLHNLPKLSSNTIEDETYHSTPANISIFNNNIIYYCQDDNYSESEKKINGKIEDVAHVSYSFYFEYTETDAKHTKIPVIDIFNILKSIGNPWYCKINSTKGYVSIDDVSESKYNSIKNKIKQKNTYYNKKLYIFNPSIVKNIQEGYAIDLDSLKYVVESENTTLEEAVQKIRDVNYIDDISPMYCVLPDNINETISLESFITLYNSLTESRIIPVRCKELESKK